VTLNEELGVTMVIVTHNPELASMMQRTLRLIDGQLRQE
jgi:lipoprotein-releasing system ATP-binding protein